MNLLFFCLIILKFSVYEIPIFVHVKVIFCSSHNITLNKIFFTIAIFINVLRKYKYQKRVIQIKLADIIK